MCFVGLVVFIGAVGTVIVVVYNNAEKWWDDSREFVSDIRIFLKMRHDCKNVEEEAKKRQRIQRYMDFGKSGGDAGR